MWTVGALVLLSAALRVCPLHLARDSSAVSKLCSQKCVEAAVLNDIASAQCKYYCSLPQIDMGTLCRSTLCLENVSCTVACQAYNVTAGYSFNNNYLCSQQLITRQRSLIVKFYWLPTTAVPLTNLKKGVLTFDRHLSCQHNKTGQFHLCVGVDNVHDIALKFDKTGLLFQATNYGFDYEVIPDSVRYQLLKPFEILSSIYLNRDQILMPECSRPADSRKKRCNDHKYLVYEDTEIYPPLTAAIDSLPVTTMTICDGSEQELVLSTVFKWSSSLHDWRAQDPDYPLALSCWCWKTCDVIHNIHVHYWVKSALLNLSAEVEKNITTSPTELTMRPYQANHKGVISARWSNVSTMAGLGIHGNLSLKDVNITVKVKMTIMSFFAVNHYFGPLQAPQAEKHWDNVKLNKQHHDCGQSTKKQMTGTTSSFPFHETTKTPPSFLPSSEHMVTSLQGKKGAAYPKATSNTTITLIIAVVCLVFLVIVVFLTVVVCRIKHTCPVWRTSKSLDSLRLQRLLRRVDSSSSAQQRTNYSYQTTPEYWPTFPRSQLKFESQVGQGQFGEVYMATAVGITTGETQTKVAVKILQEGKSLKDENDFLEEADHLRKFRHPHIVQLLGVCLEQVPKMIILELMDGGDLLSYLQNHRPEVGRPPWDDAEYVDIALDISSALKYLEKEKFVHRDVAARNCLVSFGPFSQSLATKSSSCHRIVKLGDFGLARDIHERDYYRSMDPKAMLPICWMAPEALKNRVYSAKSDVWSFGILLWEVFTYGDTPYAQLAAHPIEAYNLITTGVTLSQPQYCPNPIFRLMKQCWAAQPEQRPTFRALDDLLIMFQKSLTRRKTLLTTLTSTLQSIASVGDIVDVDQDTCQQPHTQVPVLKGVHTTEPAFESVFIDSIDEQSLSGISEYQTSGLEDSAFENPSDNSSQSSHLQAAYQSFSKQVHRPDCLAKTCNPTVELGPSVTQSGETQIVGTSPEDSSHSSHVHECEVNLSDLLLSESSV